MNSTVSGYFDAVLNSVKQYLVNIISVVLAAFTLTLSPGSNAQLLSGGLVTDPDLVDNRFEEYYLRPCLDGPGLVPGDGGLVTDQGWSLTEVIDYNNSICNVFFSGGSFDSSTYASTTNIGTNGAQTKAANNAASQQVASVKDRLEELGEDESPKNGWGVLLAVQQGETERIATNNEIGFDSELESFIIGGDYRFNNALVAGVALGHTSDEATFNNNTGFIDTTSDSLTLYFTFVPVEGAYIDGYIGQSSLDFDNSRDLSVSGEPADMFGFTGIVAGSFSGDQDLSGISGGYDWYLGNFSVGPYAALDSIKTTVDGYDEQGTTGLELRYPEQTTRSRLLYLGLNLGYTISYGWGALVPTFSMSQVHESKDDARTYNARLIVLPAVDTSTLLLQTDAPDKDYTLTSLGIAAALNNGTQIFLTYEEIGGHDFLDTWAMTAGVLAEF